MKIKMTNGADIIRHFFILFLCLYENMFTMNRIDRLSAILIMLQSSSVVKTKQIADRFDIGTRTVYRDIRALEDAGIPIAGTAGTGYSLVDGFKLPPLMFTQEEAFAFLAAERLVYRFTDAGFKEGYKAGIEKIRAVMRLAEKETMENLDDKIHSLEFRSTQPSESENTLQVLMSEVAQKKKVKLVYFSYDKQEETERVVDPIGLFFSLSNWYLVAFCNIRNDYRTFRISRIKSLETTDDGFNIEHPPLNSFLEKLSEREKLHEVVIEVSKSDFSLINETKYYQGLIAEKEVGDKVELHFMVFSLERFSRWYLSFVDIVTIVSPRELEEKAKEIISKARL